MIKKVIQVPVDEELLSALDRRSRKQDMARAGLIREACRWYLEQAEVEELDKLYQLGYERVPEGPQLGETQTDLAGEILSQESW